MTEQKSPEYWSSLLMQIRKVNRWTQSQLGDSLGVSRDTVYRWEQELKYPSLENQMSIGRLATSLNVASIYGIAAVITNSPFPMILTDKYDMVLAASKCSGFVTGMTVIEQTPESERDNYTQFSKMVSETGFWEKADNLLEYDFEIHGEPRKAVIHSVGSRGHIFAVVQKR